MDDMYKKIVESINSYIIITDFSNKVIYKNNDIALDIFNNNPSNLKELLYNDKIYSVYYASINNYNMQVYSDITNYKNKISKLKRDYLTGLYNRFAIIEELDKIKNENYILIMTDIDYFKRINDGYGHLVGDYVLKGISKLLVKNISKNGIVGRYGGEEFIIIISNLEINEAYILIEKIRKEIEKTKIKVKYNDCIKEFHISMTFGMTENKSKKNINELISEADQALYIGKNNGRNQTVIYKKDEV